MTVYQELQLNQAGSKALIRSCTNRKDKMRHTAIYLFKMLDHGILHGSGYWIQ